MSDIDNPSMPCQQNNGSNEYKSIVEEIDEITPDCVVQFYRSKQEMKGGTKGYGYADNYQKKDGGFKTEPKGDFYDATFGFDRFNSEVCAEFDISKYKKLNHLIPKDAIVKKINLYLCPYLTIQLNQKIAIYARAEEFLDKNSKGTEVEIVFKSKSMGLTISPSKQNLKIGDENSICKIEIECKSVFENTCIEAYQKVSSSEGEKNVLVGKINVIGNKTRYKTIIRPVVVRLFSGKNGKKDFLNSATNAEQNVIDAYKTLIPYLQDYSFNQAYIKCEEDPAFPATPADIQNSKNHYVEIDIDKIAQKYKDLITHDTTGNAYYLMGSKEDFFDLIAMEYTGKNAAVIKDAAIANTQVKEKITKLMQELRKGFKFDKSIHKSGEDCYKAKLLTNAFHRESSFLGLGKKRPVIEAHRKYREARQEYLTIIKKAGVSPGYGEGLMDNSYKNGYVHVYFFPDIARADSEDKKVELTIEDIRGGTYVPGIANTGRGTAYMMNVCIDPGTKFTPNTEEAYKSKEAYIAHEVGHTLGLEHPFKNNETDSYQTDEGKEYSNKIDKKKQLEYLQLNYEKYKNGKIDEDGKEIGVAPTSTGGDCVSKLYSYLANYIIKLADNASQWFLIDQTTQEVERGKLFIENLDDFKNGWEPVDNPAYFDPKMKSKTQYWSSNLIAPDKTNRDWNKEFDEFCNDFSHSTPLFKHFELALYMELMQAPLQPLGGQTATITTGTNKVIKTKEEIKDEICRLELEIEELEKKQHLLFNKVDLQKHIKQSKTEENFMDYTFIGESKNNNFIHKSFRHYQWTKMWNDSKDKFLNTQ